MRLDDNGLEGFVDLRKDPEKFSYDKWTASLTSTTRRFQLEQPVELSFHGVTAKPVPSHVQPGGGLRAEAAKVESRKRARKKKNRCAMSPAFIARTWRRHCAGSRSQGMPALDQLLCTRVTS